MKLFMRFLPLLLVVAGLLNYIYMAKGIGLTLVLLSLGVIVGIFNLMKKQYIVVALISIVIIIGSVALFYYLVNAGV
ncbi:hypothetical protein CFK37_19350 [Virgibacillus phasianinus]|uniref:Uncharacterized protein n=1 Tax=Virgibacillus phasianinus TaxID=2017483 RepID=A0A220U8V0_9BACI|nr:hypothetical protein [Virgibacillus phasianinus]ASK64153.1 hypothetical protein CFK37_19350 [Virgibacillus phasianinus]